MAAILTDMCVNPQVTGKTTQRELGVTTILANLNEFFRRSQEQFLDEKSVLSKEEQTNEFQIKEDNIEQSLSTDSLNTNKIVNQHSKVPSKLPLKKERIKPSGSGRRLSYSTETDEKLLQWVKNLKDNQFNVTREMLQRQALSVIQIECPEFKASSGWVEKFLVRHGITLPGMCRSLHSLQGDAKRNSEASVEKVEVPKEPVIRMFVRLFVDENLDRLVPISKQPKEKISAIILSCQRQFPEFSERARKRIRTYLKSCRRSSRLKEPMKRSADNMPSATAHIPSAQLAEVNNILSQACYNESNEVAKRARYDDDVTNHDSVQSKQFQDKSNVLQIVQNNSLHVHNQQHERNAALKSVPFSTASRTPPVKLSSSEIAAVRQLVSGYRESAAFLYRSADELENLLKQSEHYYGQQDPQKQT
eukprot:gene4592-5195_t